MYEKIVKWKSNLFKMPSGAVGKAFIRECDRLLGLWANKTASESFALTAIFAFIPLMLQKPSKSSKNSDHIKYLQKRLEFWKIGDFDALLSEGEAIQGRLIQNRRKPEHV